MWTNTIMLKIVKIEEGSCLSQFFFIHLHKIGIIAIEKRTELSKEDSYITLHRL